MSKPRNAYRRILRTGGALALLLSAVSYALWLYPYMGIPFNAQRHTRPPLTPPWALECWLWEDDVNTAAGVMELLDGYRQHDIPVRTIMIDSPWSLRYNDFAVDEARYPDPARFFCTLDARGYRVVLWMTCMVDSRSKDTAAKDSQGFYEEARRRGFLAGGGEQVRWWKGKGGFIDYTNPEAMTWWRGMQQQVFDWGLDGWKLDGTDTLFSRWGFLPYQKTSKGWITTREYMDLYSREEYRYGLTRNPEFVVLTRGVDSLYWPLTHPEGYAPIDAAPVAWVGDRIHAFSSKRSSAPGKDAMRDTKSWVDRGLEGALRDILASSRLGYCVVGDDVAGYHGPEPIPADLYIRWAQFAAFTGLFLNGGHGERALWKRSPEELRIIRAFSWLHTELVPYMYTHVVQCHEGGPSLMRPVKGEHHYLFGGDLLVAPIYRDELTSTVVLPAGRWRYLFRDTEAVDGPATFSRDFPLHEFPVYVRDGAIVPLDVSRAYTGFGDSESAGFLTLAIYPAGTSELTVHHPDRSGSTHVRVSVGPPLTVSLSGVRKPHILRILTPTHPKQVMLDGSPLAKGTGWSYDETTQRLVVKTRTYERGQYRVTF